MIRLRVASRLFVCAAVLLAAPVLRAQSARAVVDTAIARMGGRAALDSVRTVRYELMTQWLRLSTDDQPLRDSPSYERQTEWRDYKAKVWRNVRRSIGASLTLRELTDLVMDSVGARRMPSPPPGTPASAIPAAIDGWVPLNVAYIDERRELFMWAAERLVTGLADANDLRALPDTGIAGDAHARVSATLDGFPVVAFFRKSTGLPTAIRFRADESNDFGLAPWGPMEVEIWYSRWVIPPTAGVLIPVQWDTKRAGRLYKRMTVLSATFNTALPADSTWLPDTVGKVFRATSMKPMGDQPIDSASTVAGGRVLVFYGTGAPSGALRIGNSWMLLDGGNLPVNADRAAAWISTHAPGGVSNAGHAILTASVPGSIAVWAARKGDRVYAAEAGAIAANITLKNFGMPVTSVQTITAGRWLQAPAGSAKDSVWVEPIDGTSGSGLIVYSPSQKYAYSAAVSSLADVALVTSKLRARGFQVELVGVPGRLAGIAAR